MEHRTGWWIRVGEKVSGVPEVRQAHVRRRGWGLWAAAYQQGDLEQLP